MTVYAHQAMRVEKFGGLNTLVNATNLPEWASPDCSDVEFFPGLVKTRPGLSVQIGNLGGGTVKVNYLKTYINSLLQHRMLALAPGIASLSNSGGVLYKEAPQGTMNIVSQTISSNYCASCSAFTREYLAFGDGQFGVDIPRQFDDTNLDRVSQEGPGAAPIATDYSNSGTIDVAPNGIHMLAAINIVASPNGLSQNGNLVTLNATATPGVGIFKAGDTVVVSGAGVAGYNGTFPISRVLQETPTIILQYVVPTSGLANSGNGSFVTNIALVQIPAGMTGVPNGGPATVSGVGVAGYNGTWNIRQGGGGLTFLIALNVTGLAASGGGTFSVSGNIIAGVHQVTVLFVDREGYITRPAPPASWTAAGSKRVLLSAIPTGPPNIVQRIVAFTALTGDNFFYIATSADLFSANMVIPDNTTTTATFDFNDQLLLDGTNVDALFDLVVLGECAGNIAYSSRLFWWGERNQLQNLLNVGFDGGFTTPGASPNFPYGWQLDPTFSSGGASALAQGYPVYSGDAYAIVGNGATATRGKITQTLYRDANGDPILNPNFSYSIRARLAKNGMLASGTLHINAFSSSGGISTTGISVTPSQLATWYQEFTAVLLTSQPTIPADLVLQVFADGTPTNNGAFLVDNIEIYPTIQPFTDASTVRASKVEDPESYDGVTGFLQVAQGDGTRVTSAFVLRNNLYFAKERNLYVTQDDGTNEPAEWTIQQISEKVGTLSVKGIGVGDEWVVIAAQDGLYLFEGFQPQKISQEIQPTWDSINWQYGYLVEVVVDTRRKRIYVSAPFGSSTVQNKILTLDFTEGFAEQQDGVGRKWAPWAVTAGSMNLILRDDATLPLFVGNGLGNGAIYKLDSNAFSDDGSPIDSYWQSGYFQGDERMNFGYLVANVVGAGSCLLTLKKGGQTNSTVVRGWTLKATEVTNMERQIQKQAYRCAIRFETNAAGDNFSLQSLAMYVNSLVYAPVRGINQ